MADDSTRDSWMARQYSHGKKNGMIVLHVRPELVKDIKHIYLGKVSSGLRQVTHKGHSRFFSLVQPGKLGIGSNVVDYEAKNEEQRAEIIVKILEEMAALGKYPEDGFTKTKEQVLLHRTLWKDETMKIKFPIKREQREQRMEDDKFDAAVRRFEAAEKEMMRERMLRAEKEELAKGLEMRVEMYEMRVEMEDFARGLEMERQQSNSKMAESRQVIEVQVNQQAVGQKKWKCAPIVEKKKPIRLLIQSGQSGQYRFDPNTGYLMRLH